MAQVNVIDQARGDGWVSYCGDSAEVLAGIPSRSIDFSVYSPPFQQIFAYSASARDLGNSSSGDEFWTQFGFIIREQLRVMKPGRNVAVHVMQIPILKTRDGFIGLSDFRGDTIRNFTQHGFIYHGEATISKGDAQAQAIRTHAKGLLFVQMQRDSLWSRPALADYVIIFRTPGESEVPVVPDIENETWVEWADPIWRIQDTEADARMACANLLDLAPGTPLTWSGIDPGDTLNRRRADGYAGLVDSRDHDDNRHIAPLQLGTIERCIRLWSNKGEIVLSPFSGIASEGYEAIRLGRRFVGCELKRLYWECGVKNLQRIEAEVKSGAVVASVARKRVPKGPPPDAKPDIRKANGTVSAGRVAVTKATGAVEWTQPPLV